LNTTKSIFLNYLRSPYPYYYGKTQRIIFISLLFFLASFTFSYLFEPFDVNQAEHKLDYFWICLIHAGNPLVLGFSYFFVLNHFQKDESKWTVGNEMRHLLILLLLIGIGSFLVRDIIYDKADNWSLRYFLEEIRNTFLVGVLLLIVFVPLNLERLLNKYKLGGGVLDFGSGEQASNSKIVRINTPIASEGFELRLSDLIYAQVDGNYSDIVLQTEKGTIKRLVRISLKELEDQLITFPSIFKTHRSYLVNLDYIQSISGNAQGYLLTLSVDVPQIPVSRSRLSEFKKRSAIHRQPSQLHK